MSDASVKVCILSKCMVAGGVTVQGQRMELPPLLALDLLECNRAELVNEGDMPALMSARRRHTAALLRQAQVGRPFDGSGWRSG